MEDRRAIYFSQTDPEQLVLQNSALVLLLHYSRTMPLVNGQRYLASTAIFLSEVVKLTLFVSLALYDITNSPHSPDNSTISELAAALIRAVFTGDSWKLAIPALLYTAQNSLQYVAASHLDPTAFAVTYQLKIATTAIFVAILIGKIPSVRQWLSLGVLMFGAIIVQLSTIARAGKALSINDLQAGMSFHSPRSIWDSGLLNDESAGQFTKRSATYEGIQDDVAAANPQMNVSIGLAAAVLACILSGAAGVYLEKLLKVKGEFGSSVWIRNVQLSFYSLWPAFFIGVVSLDGEHIAKTGFFTGYNWVVWTVILVQVAGGALVAFSLSQMSSVTKTLLSSASTPITIVTGVFAFGVSLSFWVGPIAANIMIFQLTPVKSIVGTAITLCASYSYNFAPEDMKSRPPPINVSNYDKGDESGYFAPHPSSDTSKLPVRDPTREGLSTSRPGTPVSERRNLRSKSSDRIAKREQ